MRWPMVSPDHSGSGSLAVLFLPIHSLCELLILYIPVEYYSALCLLTSAYFKIPIILLILKILSIL